jgi:hypothetical protein
MVADALTYRSAVRFLRRNLITALAALLIAGVTTFIGPIAPSYAATTPNGCITAFGPYVPTCPAESPTISSADAAEGFGVSAGGSVYAPLTSGPLPGVSSLRLAAPIVGIAGNLGANHSYWLAGTDGGIFAFGFPYYGSMGGQPLNQPVVGIAATPDDGGYWLVASDGGVFAFGDAVFYGSTGGIPLNEPIVGMAPTRDGKGYWLVASDGGVFSFGDALFYGSRGGQSLASPIVGIASTRTGLGYWLASSDGGIYTYGDAPFYGADQGGGHPVVGISDAGGVCPPLPGLDCPDLYAVALSNGQVYINGPN